MRALVDLRRCLTPLGLGLLAAVGCYQSGAGVEPDDRGLYFPTGIAVSPAVEGGCEADPRLGFSACSRWLFVGSSNFDLRYSSGWVNAFDLRKIAEAARACGGAASCVSGVDEVGFVSASVRIGAFAADMTTIARRAADGTVLPNGAGRLLLPVRGDASLTAVDYDEVGGQIQLRCTPTASPGTFGTRCAPEWRLGTDAARSDRGIVLEGEPFAVAVSSTPERDLAVVAHQTSGNVSLFVDVSRDAAPGQPPPAKLAWIQGSLAGGATDVAALDTQTGGDGSVLPRFLVTNRSQSNVLLLRYFPDPKPDRSALVLTDAAPIVTQSAGFDTRGIVVDPAPAGSTRPTRVFLTNRTPAALVAGQVDPATGKLSFFENVPLPIGPSRLSRAVVDGRTLILAVSFDARSVVVYDAESRRVINVLRTHRGPYSVAVDEPRKLAYVANFTDGTIQVIELDPTRTAEGTAIIFSVGIPSGPTR